MKYQLVLQFPGDSRPGYEAMVALENELVTALGDAAEVDGFDLGANETNVFIFTSDPTASFEQTRQVLERGERLEWVTAAYRETDGESYTVLWPQGCRKEFRIA